MLYNNLIKNLIAVLWLLKYIINQKFLIDIQNIIFKFMPNKLFEKIGISKNNIISISSSMRSIDYTNEIKNISCPVYIVCGKKDKANIKAAESLNKLLSNSHMELINNSGHEVNIDNPEELSKVINRAYEEFKY